MKNLLVDLNVEQRRAVTHMGGPALVVAGAGTGKTTVISRRIAWLILNKKVQPSRILALTFTDKAAREMEERVDELLLYGVISTNIMTFHALGDDILRTYAHEIGLRTDYTVMSNFAQIVFLQQILANKTLKYFRPLGDPFSFVAILLQHFSRLKDENISPEQYKKYCNKLNKNAKTKDLRLEAAKYSEVCDIYNEYIHQSYLQAKLDFGDQIRCVIELFDKRPNVQKVFNEKYDYILVDEYQDTNTAQNILLSKLCAKNRNIMVVGDDDQSIYRFRGAALDNILGFSESFSPVKQIVLRKNYRSTKQILAASHRLIEHNNPNRLEAKYKIKKSLITTKTGPAISVIAANNIVEEMEEVAVKIKKLIQTKVKPRQIVVLLRKNNQAARLTPILQKKQIQFSLDQNINLLTRPEIKVLLHFTAYLNDPDDSTALYGLLSSEALNTNHSELVTISAQAKKTHKTIREFIISQPKSPLHSQLIFLEPYRELISELATGELLYKFLLESGYLKKLTSQSQKDPQSAWKIQNLAKFFEFVKEFELASQDPHLFTFWQYIGQVKTTTADLFTQQSILDDDAISIMTVHKAKGLEFEHVFVIDLVQNTFPATRRGDSLQIPSPLIESSPDRDWHTEDERRLFYVAMTRAKKSLTLSYSQDHGGVRAKKPSRFIAEALGATPAVQPTISITGLAQIDQFSKQRPLPINPLSVLEQDGWLRLSTNQVADYIRSPQEFWYFHVLQFPKGPFHSLVYGSSVHAAIETYYRAKINDQAIELNDLFDAFESAWKSEGFISLEHERQRKTAAKKLLRRFYTMQNKLAEKPVAVEQPFVLQLNQVKLKVTGRYDVVLARGEGVEIRDFKTGAVDTEKKAQNKLKDNPQLAIYAYAWNKTNQNPVSNVSLHFVESDIIVQQVPADNTKTLALLSDVANNIRSGKFSAKGKSMIDFETFL